MLKVGITGHRQLDNPKMVKIELNNTIQYFFSQSENMVGYTQLATGADTLFAQVLIDNNIPYIVILPVPKDVYIKDFSDEEKKFFEKYIKKASSIHIIKKSEKELISDQNYREAGIYIVDKSDVIVGVWDGEKTDKIGGTYDILSYALTLNKETHIIKGIRGNRGDVFLGVNKIFKKNDLSAIRYKKIFNFFWTFGLLCANFSLFVLLIGILFVESHETKYIVSIVEFSFILLSFLSLVYGANYFKSKFVKSRAVAEKNRILNMMNNSFLELDETNKPHLSKNQEIFITKNDLTSSLNINSLVFHNVKRVFGSIISEQINYHQLKRLPYLRKKLKLNRLFLSLCKYTFIIVVFIKLFLELFLHHNCFFASYSEVLVNTMLFLVLFIPGVYATIEGIIHFNSWNIHINQSEKILFELASLNRKLLTCSDKTIIPLLNDIINLISNESNYWKNKLEGQKVKIKI